MAVTIQDVARAAGVSVTTVSRAFSGRRAVSPATVQAVHEASERLGYRPNSVARSLRERSTRTVGMVVPRISNPYFATLMEVIEGRLGAGGRELLLCDSQNDPGVERTRVDALLDRRVDGLLLVPCHSAESADTVRHAASQVPVVQIDRFVDEAAGDYVGIDNEIGLHLVVDHLRAAGCRSFALISAEAITSSGVTRLRAYREAVLAAGADGADRMLLGHFEVSWGSEAARELLAAGPLPDAIVCGADVIALGVVSTLTAHGVRIPADVQVTGFDDIPFAALSNPPLTSLRQPADDIASEGVDLLLRRLDGDGGGAQHRIIRPELVVRATSGR